MKYYYDYLNEVANDEAILAEIEKENAAHEAWIAYDDIMWELTEALKVCADSVHRAEIEKELRKLSMVM